MALKIKDIHTNEVTYVDQAKDPVLSSKFDLQLAIAEMMEAQDEERMNMQLAIAEIAELITGGA